MSMRYRPAQVLGSANLSTLRANNAASVLGRAAKRPTGTASVLPRLLAKRSTKARTVTLGELQRKLADTKVGGAARGLKAFKEESARQARIRVTARIPGIVAAGGFTEGNYYAVVLGQTIFEHGRAVERRQQRLRIGRRGALSTRPLSTPASRTNRRGALAQPIAPGAIRSDVGAGRNQLGRAAKSAGASAESASGASRKLQTGRAPVASQRDRDARDLMAASRALPTPAPVPRPGAAGTRLRLAVRNVASVFSSRAPFAPLLDLARTPRRSALPREAARAAQAAPSQTALLTGFVGGGVGSGSRSCECPKRKPSKPRCRNPVISRTVSNNVRTTKVRLTCP